MSDNKKIPSQESEGIDYQEVVAVIMPDKSIKLVPIEERDETCKNAFKEIVKILAKNKCTVKEAQKILRFVGEHIEAISEAMTVQNTTKFLKDEDLKGLFY